MDSQSQTARHWTSSNITYVTKCLYVHPTSLPPWTFPTSPVPTNRQRVTSLLTAGRRGATRPLDKGHACPFAGKSSMHSFPAIVLQPGALISLVQVELFPSCSLSVSSTLARFYSPFDSNSLFSLLSLSHSTLTLSPLFIFWLSFSSMLLAHSLTSPTQSLFLSVSHALSLVITEESRRPDKSSVAMATAKWPDSFSTQTSGGRVAGKLRWSLAHLQTLLKASGCCNTGAHIQVCTQALCDTNHVSQGRVHIYIYYRLMKESVSVSLCVADNLIPST